MTTNDWIQSISTIILSLTAFLAPYVIERWKYTYRAPEIKITFKLSPPFCHMTQMKGPSVDYSVYYFRFLVENIGKTQAEDCEVFLEKISKENSAGKMIRIENFTPVNLKWSGGREPYKRTLQPGRRMFVDIGRIQEPNNNYLSIYRGITTKQQNQLKFVFELPDRFYSQWDCLIKGNYRIEIVIYSKNAEKTTHEFYISWSGEWEDDEVKMFNELVISKNKF